MVVYSFVNVVDFLFNTQKNFLVLLVLLGVSPVEPRKPPHHWTPNKRDDNRNPPVHRSHPTISNRLSLDASIGGFPLLLALALADCGAVKVLLAVAEAQANCGYVALEAHRTSTWEHVEGEKVAAFVTVD